MATDVGNNVLMSPDFDRVSPRKKADNETHNETTKHAETKS